MCPTINDDEVEEKWFKPWCENVRRARDRGLQLIVIGHDSNKPGGRRFKDPLLNPFRTPQEPFNVPLFREQTL